MKRVMKAAALALQLGFYCVAHAATGQVRFNSFETVEFQPASGQKLSIPYALDVSGVVEIVLYSADGDVVRTLRSKSSLKPGAHVAEWDGRDDERRMVPNEAYFPVLRCACGQAGESVVDARGNTGGVVLEKIQPQLSSDGTVSFDLAKPARTLVRIGVKGGAMMRALDTWSPRSAGRIRIEWDGFDQSKVERLLGRPGLAVLVTAFTLPQHSIIVSGGGGPDYLAYRKSRGWSVPVADAGRTQFERNGERLSRQASLPRSLLKDPRVSIGIVEPVQRHSSGAFRVSAPITLRVDMAQEDRWLVQQSLYEVGFFLDGQFVSEEETGFTPLTWRWDPAGTAAGEHTMTVNISGFWGQVGVASINLLVSDK